MAPKVSVCTITYNHERYISAAIESAVAQQVHFDVEIVVADDCSTDRTGDVLQGVARAASMPIRILRQAANVGMMRNFAAALRECRGEYVALLDGDDYWTAPRKLQLQVEFLDSHPDYTISFHKTRCVHEDGSAPDFDRPTSAPAVSTLDDILLGNSIGTPSAVFRRGLFGELPPWFYVLRSGDWALHILNAMHGKIGYIDETMAVYRIHGSGAWAGSSQITRCEAELDMLRFVDAHLGRAYSKTIRSPVALRRWMLAHLHADGGDLGEARRHLWSVLSSFPLRFPMGRRAFVALCARLLIPGMSSAIRTPAITP